MSALRPGGNAVISLIFAEYLNRLIWHSTRADVSPVDIPQWAIKLTAVAAVLVVSLICVATSILGSPATVVLTTVKIVALILITVLGLMQLARGKASTSLSQAVFEHSSSSPSAYAVGLYSSLWAFDGWDQANYVGSEMKRREKDVPRAIHASMTIVMALFDVANIVYFAVLDKATVELSNTVALDFGRTLFGAVGGVVFATMVVFSYFGVLNGSSSTTARLIYVAGKEGYLPVLFARHNSTLKMPLNSMYLQAGIMIAFILIGGGFRSLINLAVVWAFYFLTVLGLVILGIKEPMLERPDKTWIITPLVFCAASDSLGAFNDRNHLCLPEILPTTSMNDAEREKGEV